MDQTRWKALIWLVIALSTTVAMVGITILWHTWAFEKKEIVQTFWIPDGAEVIPRTDVTLRGDEGTIPVDDIEEKITQGEAPAESLLIMPMKRHPDTKEPAVRYWLDRPNQVSLNGLVYISRVEKAPRLQKWDVTLIEENTLFQYTSSRTHILLGATILGFLGMVALIVALSSLKVFITGRGISVDTKALQELAEEKARAAST